MYEIRQTTNLPKRAPKNRDFIMARDALEVGQEFSFTDPRKRQAFYYLLAPKQNNGKRFFIEEGAPNSYTVYRIS